MTINEICAIGKVEQNEQSTQIIQQYQDYITRWLDSDEFKQNHAQKPYPPLINPAKMEYEGSDPLHAWVLNMPLPKYYDFVAFGSHASGFHSAIPAFMGLCGVMRTMLIREDYSTPQRYKGSKGNYIRIFEELLRYRVCGFKRVYLQLTDMIFDEDTKKLYRLIDASKALNVVRDPIKVLTGMAACPHRPEMMIIKDNQECAFGLTLDKNPHQILKNYIYYCNSGLTTDVRSDEISLMPNINSIDLWLCDPSQSFHDGATFNLLSASLKNIKLKQTDDFVGDKAFDTMCELAEHFGFDKPKEEDKWLFKQRVSDYKHLIPMHLYAHPNMLLYTDKKLKTPTQLSQELVDESAKLAVISQFEPRNFTAKHLDISELFELADPTLCVFLHGYEDGIKLLKNPKLLKKCQKYIKELSSAMKDKAIEEKTKKFSVDDAIEYFKTHKLQRQILKFSMKQHLFMLEKFQPDIIQSWQGYQRFLELCKDDEPLNPDDLNGTQAQVVAY